MTDKQKEWSHFKFNARKFFKYIHESDESIFDDGFDIDVIADSFSVATTFTLEGQGIYVYDDIVSLSEHGTTDVIYYQNPKNSSEVYLVRPALGDWYDTSYHKTSVKMLEFLKKHG